MLMNIFIVSGLFLEGLLEVLKDCELLKSFVLGIEISRGYWGAKALSIFDRIFSVGVHFGYVMDEMEDTNM